MENVRALEDNENVIDVHTSEIEEKKKEFIKLEEDIKQVNNELSERTALISSISETSDQIKLTQETIFNYVKEDNPLYDELVKNECKKNAIEDCIKQLKKAFEEKTISLSDLLAQISQLSSKQFKCIYKLDIMEKHLTKLNVYNAK